MIKNNLLRKQYTLNETNYQLKIPMELDACIPANDCVRLIRQFVEEMDLTALYATYERMPSEKYASPEIMLKIMLYAYHERKDVSSRTIEKNCKRDINYMYLLEGRKAPDHAAIARFRSKHFAKCARHFMAQMTKFLIKLEQVTFGYEKDRTILNDVSFTIPQGSFVSLVGESGCGKSTIAALLSGSRTGYTGSVTLGGVPVQELQQEQRLRTLTLVPHNAAIFKGTVESNLRMAKPDADEAQLWAALEQVNLADFCRSQNGLQTALHEGGSNLSGGQRQRLAMARALLHDTPIYLFDEATSNVDAESENDIMQAIHSLAGKKTIILISHRLANVVHSDCIYAMSNGRVIEQGTHAELLAKQGAYSRLYLAQRQLETLEEEDA